MPDLAAADGTASDRAGAVPALRALLTVEDLGEDVYRGAPAAEGPGRVYGGQAIAQALAAATRSVGADRQAHSLHAYFLRAGDATQPIVYRVLRDFDGGSFANRRVLAMQGDTPILNLAASFHRPEDGFSHSSAMPDVPPPEACPDLAAAMAAAGQVLPPVMVSRLAAFDVRPCPRTASSGTVPQQFLWFRLAAATPPEDALARPVLAYASDFALLSTAALPHTRAFFTPRLQAASLDHAVWFHAAPALSDWMLYAMDSPWAGNARGFTRGAIHDRTGTLIASVAQEGLCRAVPAAPKPDHIDAATPPAPAH